MRLALLLSLAGCSAAVARGQVPAGWCYATDDHGTVTACYAGPTGEANCAADRERYDGGACAPYFDDACAARDGE